VLDLPAVAMGTKRSQRTVWSLASFTGAVTLLTSCAIDDGLSTLGYEKATMLKADSVRLMSEAERPFTSLQKEVDEYERDLARAYEFEKGRQNNQTTIEEYRILVDPNRNSIIGVLNRWKAQGTLRSSFIQDAIFVISAQWDAIIRLEDAKQQKH
jgi:hypothetical protein